MIITKAVNYILVKIMSLLPPDRSMIVFRSRPDYADNARAFSDYLLQLPESGGYRIVWLVDHPETRHVRGVEFIKRDGKGITFRKDYCLARAGFVVFTHAAPIRSWRKDQLFIHTTHSASQLKDSIGFNEKARTNARYPDYHLVCGSDGAAKRIRRPDYSPENMLRIGMPRLDLLFRHRDCIGILYPENRAEKVIIALETFKQSKNSIDSSETKVSFGLNMIRSMEELRELDAYLGRSHAMLIIKPHPLQLLDYVKQTRLENIRFITDEELGARDIQLYELLENVDALITDYSSVFYDYLLLDRPIGFTLGDMEEYQRGFITDHPLEEMPGEKIRSMDELKAFVDDVRMGKDDYAGDRAAMISRVFDYPDDKNCERLYLFLKEHGLKERPKKQGGNE